MSLKEKLLNRSKSYIFYKQKYESLLNDNKKLNKKIHKLSKQLQKQKKRNARLNKRLNNINNSNQQLNSKINHESLRLREINYGFIFNDTIAESAWLKKRNFSLNNSASNYSFMYTLFRILDEIKPKNILELGLGQTSKMTSQYANYHAYSNLMIIDNNQSWIDVFSKNLNISDNIKLIQRDNEIFSYKGSENIRYSKLDEIVGEMKFDLIIIDGPQGYFSEPVYSELDYSRSNIWDLVDNLNDEFIIIIDDYNRHGEKNTMSRLIELLKEKNIQFYTFKSIGIKEQFVICTEKYRFVSWF